jgi:membrane protein required for colicin V production
VNYLDLIILFFLVFGLYKGQSNGLIKEISSVIGLVLAILIASNFNDELALYLLTFIELQDSLIKIISFFILFFIVIKLVEILAKLITKLAKIIALGLVNKILGAVFGLIKNLLICCTIYYVFEIINSNLNLIELSIIESSKFYSIINFINNIISSIFQSKTI